MPPALRNPPEFEVLPASIFWNREEDKVRITFTTTSKIELFHFILRSNYLKSVDIQFLFGVVNSKDHYQIK